jgi:hypothetical protein
MKKLLIIIFAIGLTTLITGCAHHYHYGSGYDSPRYGYSGYRRPHYGYPPVNNHWHGDHHHRRGYRSDY